MSDERLICPGQIIRDASGPNTKTNMSSVRQHGPGLIVQYTVRYQDGRKEYRVAIINSRGRFAGSMLVQ